MGSRHEEEVPTHLSASTTRSGRVRFYMMKIRSLLAEVGANNTITKMVTW